MLVVVHQLTQTSFCPIGSGDTRACVDQARVHAQTDEYVTQCVRRCQRVGVHSLRSASPHGIQHCDRQCGTTTLGSFRKHKRVCEKRLVACDKHLSRAKIMGATEHASQPSRKLAPAHVCQVYVRMFHGTLMYAQRW